MSSYKSYSKVNPDFSVRIVVCDHYLTKPTPDLDVIYSEFRGSDIKQVPVLRIFGPALDGHKACLHVHGVFPYFYIPCPSSDPEPQFLYQIAASLDKALNIALKQATSINQHVYKISLVKGLPFYGFHDKEHLYLKVFLYNPGLIKQAVELCSNGAILGQTFQPHESHLNFTLQFFIDFNLFGMSNIDLQSVSFRKTGQLQKSNDTFQNSGTFENNGSSLKPESMCYYECDCVASHIINRQRVGRGDGIENPGLEEVWQQEKERRKQLNVSMASKSLSQARLNDETDTHYKFQQMCIMKISSLTDKPVIVDSPLEEIYYPAESRDDSELFKAVDVSIHLPGSNSCSNTFNETLNRDFDETLTQDLDNTIVDESVALNCRLHYSQIPLNSQDLDLLDMLQDMDEEKPLEEDSDIASAAVFEQDTDSDDAEYSQAYNEDTILNPNGSKEDNDDKSPSWNDSFWSGASIPQLDGTFDDDHVKKVRKRKMRPLKVGLSRPKQKRNIVQNIVKEEPKSDKIESDDEINVSQETMDSISCLHLKKAVKREPYDFENVQKGDLKKYIKTEPKNSSNSDTIETSIIDHTKDDENRNEVTVTDLVYKITVNQEKLLASESYDLKNKFEPLPGPSNINMDDTILNSSPEDNLGIVSFYNKSKIFDLSLNDSDTVSPEVFVPSSNEIMDYSPSQDHYKCQSEVAQEENKEVYVKEEISEFRETILKNGDIQIENPNKTIQIEGLIKQEFEEPVKDKLINIEPTIPNSDNKLHYSFTHCTMSQSNMPNECKRRLCLIPKFRPPTKQDVIASLEKYNIPKVKNPEPYFSDPKDVGEKVEIGHMVLKLHSKHACDQKPFERVLNTTTLEEWRQLLFLQTNDMTEEAPKPETLRALLSSKRRVVLQPVKKPPLKSEVIRWLNERDKCEEKNKNSICDSKVCSATIDDLDNSQAIGLNYDVINSSLSFELDDKEKTSNSLQITMQPDGSFLCFGNGASENTGVETATIEIDFLTIMVTEVLTTVRGDLHPDPSHDDIQAIFYTITNDVPSNHFLDKCITEIIVVDSLPPPKYLDRCIFNVRITYVQNESEILEKIIELVNKHDPDIICGYDIEVNSWGYILERAQALGLEIVQELSRITEKNRQKRWRSDENDFEGRIIGRVMFNVWRLFRHELALSSYSFENCMYEILKERVPKYSFAQLADWWGDESRILRWIPVEYYLTRLSGTVRMLEKLDIINRTSELARLFGLQWWEVLSRGSQFRVESLMLRAARPLNLIALSPSVKQRAAMKAPECLPLIFEPESRFYSDPVIVLDFQSLYPSMMIAYNYCFSTCIGRVHNINGDAAYEFGAWRLRIPKAKLETLVKSDLVHWSPVGVGFVKQSVRRGVLPALLRRILAARQAVKKGMKLQTDESIKKAMHSRQLGLKLIANVTYGYTAANFSGRMPCVEVGDSVVAKGRETLERAIKLVRDNTQWNAKVVYGDTDSMFVLVPGGSRADAFRIGQEIANAVTADNPSPVALKLEKVYQPCILQTKKRYVGYMYESAEQQTPVYEAKGIETVRRDGCPAGVKLLQRCLCELFSSGDMSKVKRIVTSTLSQLCDGTLPAHQLFFTREYHGVAGYKPGAAAPPNEIAKRIACRDRRAVPRTGERVSWLVTSGAPNTPLVKLARTPQELIKEPATPHVSYYAARVLLPPVHRCLSLLGANVFKWWNDLGFTREIQVNKYVSMGGIARYMRRERCTICGARDTRALCQVCAKVGGKTAVTLAGRLTRAKGDLIHCDQICTSCCGHPLSSECVNTECPALWRRISAQQKLTQVRDVITHLPADFTCEPLDF